ncbi:MAG: hypothetical protein ACE5NG_17240 [bacterium]
MKLKSMDFEDDGDIPSEFTCDKRDISPQLSTLAGFYVLPEDSSILKICITDSDS